jgi:4a-hydroxytetrahydrobiopterin dehydratase
MKALTQRQVTTKLKSLHEDWEVAKAGTSISRKYPFKSYIAGFMFVTKISVHAQVALHFPEVTLSDRFVKITLMTKDVKALTDQDFVLASHFDAMYVLSTTNVQTAHNHY